MKLQFFFKDELIVKRQGQLTSVSRVDPPVERFTVVVVVVDMRQFVGLFDLFDFILTKFSRQFQLMFIMLFLQLCLSLNLYKLKNF